MKANSLYELLVENKHIDIMIMALNNYIHSQYEGIDLEIADVPETLENIKITTDMRTVLKHQLGLTKQSPKQTSDTTGLMWCKEIDLDEYCDQAMFDQHNDTHDHTVSELLHKAWDNVKDKHWDTIKRMGDR